MGYANALQVVVAGDFIQWDTASPVPSVSPSGKGRIYFDGTVFKASENTGAYVNLVGGGSSPFTTSGTNILTTLSTYDTLILNDTTTSAFVSRTVKAPDGTATALGSYLDLKGGAGGATSGNGGQVSLSGGTASGAANTGGGINISAGNNTTATGNGGNVTISAGSPSGAGTSGTGGTVNITAGSSNGAPGAVNITGGTGNTTPGGVIISGGQNSGLSGSGGTATLRGGSTSQAPASGGSAVVTGGTPVDGNGGDVTVSGSAGVGTNRNGGSVAVSPGAATGTGTAGTVQLCTTTAQFLRFYGTASGTAQQTVAGSRGGNAALTSLLSALAALGLINDTTTP